MNPAMTARHRHDVDEVFDGVATGSAVNVALIHVGREMPMDKDICFDLVSAACTG